MNKFIITANRRLRKRSRLVSDNPSTHLTVKRTGRRRHCGGLRDDVSSLDNRSVSRQLTV
jgi:hypothetical protein